MVHRHATAQIRANQIEGAQVCVPLPNSHIPVVAHSNVSIKTKLDNKGECSRSRMGMLYA